RARLSRQLIDHRQSVAIWHLHVEKHQIRVIPVDRSECLSPAGALADDLDGSFAAQKRPQAVACQRFVIHQKCPKRGQSQRGVSASAVSISWSCSPNINGVPGAMPLGQGCFPKDKSGGRNTIAAPSSASICTASASPGNRSDTFVRK